MSAISHRQLGWAPVVAALTIGACASTRAGAPASAAARPANQQTTALPAASGTAAAAQGGRRAISPRAQRLFDDAVAAEAEQKRLGIPTDWEALERRWRAVVEAEPIPEAYFNLGVALEHEGRRDDARAAYRRAVELDPRLGAAAVNLELLGDRGDPRDAAQAWAELLRRFPEDPVPRVRLAALYEEAGQHDEAWRLAREALLRDPRSVAAYKIMMRVALDRDRLDLAQLLALKARKLDEKDPEIASFVGDVDLRQKDEAAAVAQWKKAVELGAGYLPARYALLAHALRYQQWASVVEQATAILKSNPSDARVRLALGVAYRHQAQPDKALAEYAEVERIAPGRLPEVFLARGVALMKGKEQCEPALAEFKRYLLAAGPAAAGDSAAPRLERECEQIVAATQQAEEASREMKAQAERETARNASGAHGTNADHPAPGEARPAPGPIGTTRRDESDKGRETPTR